MISGTMITGISALLAALIPLNESSITIVFSLAGAPLFFQALLNMSGAGLASATSSAEIIVLKEAGSTSVCFKKNSISLL